MPVTTDWPQPAQPLALTMGDPAGIGPEIAIRAWAALRHSGPAFMLVGAPEVFDATLRRLGLDASIEQVASAAIARQTFAKALPILPRPLGTDRLPRPGTPDTAHAGAVLDSIATAVRLTREGETSAVVTNPIAKSVLYEAGFPHPGHTEYLAKLVSAPDEDTPRPVMMLVGGGLRVALATIHMPLREAVNALRTDRLERLGETVHDALQRDFGIAAPRLAFTGLNPHAGEDGTLGREETLIINPAADTLRGRSIDITDARPADTVFAEALSGRFDAVIAMTHDQGLIPVKTLDFWGGVNTTLGLAIIRTSPDHGTAFDMAAGGGARADSLIAAIRLACDMADRRRAHGETAHA